MIDEEKKKRIWDKMTTPPGMDISKFKLDACGALICWDQYGNRQSDVGWEIDHVIPKALLLNKDVPDEEIDDEINLRPMHWKNNDSKSLDYPEYHSKIKYEDGKNVDLDGIYEVNKTLQMILHNKYSKYGL